MDLFGNTPNWEINLAPILKKYSQKKHPLAYQNRYQLLVMVLLSAQDSDANINSLAPLLFQNFPSIESLSVAKKTALIPYIANVKNVETKVNWLLEIAKTISKNENIPLTMEGLTALKGIGRKSANVILREANQPAVGIIVDLHVIRVAPRIGLTPVSTDGNKIEKQLMELLPKRIWGEIVMAISFLGRETCRPTP